MLLQQVDQERHGAVEGLSSFDSLPQLIDGAQRGTAHAQQTPIADIQPQGRHLQRLLFPEIVFDVVECCDDVFMYVRNVCSMRAFSEGFGKRFGQDGMLQRTVVQHVGTS